MIDNVISAYEAVKMNGVSQGIIALCSFIAVIIVIQKFVTAWKEAFSEGDKPVDMKQFFKLFYIYIYVFAIIMVAPFAFTRRGNGTWKSSERIDKPLSGGRGSKH